MKHQVLVLVCLALSQAAFLEETLTSHSYAPLGTIFLQEAPVQELETATPPEPGFDPESTLKSAEQQQALIAKSYDQDLAAEGDCIILYAECNYKGPSFKYCNQPDEKLQFQLAVHSVYIPIGSSLKTKDKFEGNKINLIYSHECITEGFHIPEPQTHQSEISSWFDELQEKDKQLSATKEIPTPPLKFYDNEGNAITKEAYQKMVEEDIQKSHDFYEGKQLEYATAPNA